MIRGAIFDLDGVLLDSMGIWEDLGARYLRAQGITPEPGLNAILFAMSMEQGAAYLKAHYPLPQSEAEIGDGIARMVADYYFYEVPAKPGAAALLAFLAERNIPMAAATSSPRTHVTQALRRLGLLPYLKGISPGFSLRQRSASASMSRQFTCWPPRPCTPRRRKRSSLRTVSTP